MWAGAGRGGGPGGDAGEVSVDTMTVGQALGIGGAVVGIMFVGAIVFVIGVLLGR